MPEDQYGRYEIEDNDPQFRVPPANATLSERIAAVLRTDDKWAWREAINIHGYTIFELLREAHEQLRQVEQHENPIH